MNKLFLALLIMQSIFSSSVAHAYMGPGMAGGAIAAIAAFFGAIILFFVAIIYFPIKRALGRIRSSKSKKKQKKPD